MDSDRPEESLEVLPSPMPPSSSSKRRFLDRLPLFRRRNDIDDCGAANS